MANVRCGACFGRRTSTCPGCGGQRQKSRLTINLEVELYMCMVCGGRGSVPCSSCHGRGEIYAPDAAPTFTSGRPEPSADPPPEGIEGRWTAPDGSWWQFDGTGPRYTASGGSALGTTEQGFAVQRGNIVDLTFTNMLLGEYQLRVQRRGETLEGSINVMGFLAPIVLRRTSWPARPRSVTDQLKEKYTTALEGAVAAKNAGDGNRALRGFLDALEVAMTSPQPDDDIEAMQHILVLSRAMDLPDASIDKCADCVFRLVRDGHRNDAVAQILAFVIMLAQARQLERLDALLDAAAQTLQVELHPEIRVSLAGAAIRGLIARDRVDRATALLEDLPRDGLSSDQIVEVACLESDIAIASSDRDHAADVLVEVLRARRDCTPEKRLDAVSKLIAAWPPGRAGVQPWVDELDAGVSGRPEPMRSMTYLQLAIASAQGGNLDQARWAMCQADLERVRRQAPPGMDQIVEHVLGQVRELIRIAEVKKRTGA